MGASSYADLTVWQRAMDHEGVYRSTERFPQAEIYGLTSQFRRAAVSIPSNIAEGNARDSTKEYLRFLSVAQGSLAELETQLLLAGRLNLLDQTELEPLSALVAEVRRMAYGLRNALKRRSGSKSWPLARDPRPLQ